MSDLAVLSRCRNPAGLSLGAVAMAGIGLAIYQLTSLELGPTAQDIRVNLNLDAPGMQDVAQPLEKADAAIGQVLVVLRRTPDAPRGARPAWTAGAPVNASTTVRVTAPAPTPLLPTLPAAGQALPAAPSTHGLPPQSPSGPTATIPSPPSQAAPAQPAAPVTSPAQPAPIIGRCQNSSTGWLSGTSPSNGWGDEPASSPCSEAGGRD